MIKNVLFTLSAFMAACFLWYVVVSLGHYFGVF
jgi:hypothetical protein